MIVVLSDIRSAHNVGSIFRTADAVGAEKIILCGVTPAPSDRYGRTVLDIEKAALGAEKTVPWEKADSVVRTINKLKKDGWRVIAVEQDADSVAIDKISMKKEQKIAFILGNEVDGLSKKILKLVNDIIEIPMFGEKESLNVSVAFGVVAYAWKMVNK